MNDYVNANKSKMEIVNDISVFVIFSMVDKGIQQVASLFFVKITSPLINNLIIPNNNISIHDGCVYWIPKLVIKVHPWRLSEHNETWCCQSQHLLCYPSWNVQKKQIVYNWNTTRKSRIFQSCKGMLWLSTVVYTLFTLYK